MGWWHRSGYYVPVSPEDRCWSWDKWRKERGGLRRGLALKSQDDRELGSGGLVNVPLVISVIAMGEVPICIMRTTFSIMLSVDYGQTSILMTTCRAVMPQTWGKLVNKLSRLRLPGAGRIMCKSNLEIWRSRGRSVS